MNTLKFVGMGEISVKYLEGWWGRGEILPLKNIANLMMKLSPFKEELKPPFKRGAKGIPKINSFASST